MKRKRESDDDDRADEPAPRFTDDLADLAESLLRGDDLEPVCAWCPLTSLIATPATPSQILKHHQRSGFIGVRDDVAALPRLAVSLALPSLPNTPARVSFLLSLPVSASTNPFAHPASERIEKLSFSPDGDLLIVFTSSVQPGAEQFLAFNGRAVSISRIITYQKQDCINDWLCVHDWDANTAGLISNPPVSIDLGSILALRWFGDGKRRQNGDDSTNQDIYGHLGGQGFVAVTRNLQVLLYYIGPGNMPLVTSVPLDPTTAVSPSATLGRCAAISHARNIAGLGPQSSILVAYAKQPAVDGLSMPLSLLQEHIPSITTAQALGGMSVPNMQAQLAPATFMPSMLPQQTSGPLQVNTNSLAAPPIDTRPNTASSYGAGTNMFGDSYGDVNMSALDELFGFGADTELQQTSHDVSSSMLLDVNTKHDASLGTQLTSTGLDDNKPIVEHSGQEKSGSTAGTSPRKILSGLEDSHEEPLPWESHTDAITPAVELCEVIIDWQTMVMTCKALPGICTIGNDSSDSDIGRGTLDDQVVTHLVFARPATSEAGHELLAVKQCLEALPERASSQALWETWHLRQSSPALCDTFRAMLPGSSAKPDIMKQGKPIWSATLLRSHRGLHGAGVSQASTDYGLVQRIDDGCGHSLLRAVHASERGLSIDGMSRQPPSKAQATSADLAWMPLSPCTHLAVSPNGCLAMVAPHHRGTSKPRLIPLPMAQSQDSDSTLASSDTVLLDQCCGLARLPRARQTSAVDHMWRQLKATRKDSHTFSESAAITLVAHQRQLALSRSEPAKALTLLLQTQTISRAFHALIGSPQNTSRNAEQTWVLVAHTAALVDLWDEMIRNVQTSSSDDILEAAFPLLHPYPRKLHRGLCTSVARFAKTTRSGHDGAGATVDSDYAAAILADVLRNSRAIIEQITRIVFPRSPSADTEMEADGAELVAGCLSPSKFDAALQLQKQLQSSSAVTKIGLPKRTSRAADILTQGDLPLQQDASLGMQSLKTCTLCGGRTSICQPTSSEMETMHRAACVCGSRWYL